MLETVHSLMAFNFVILLYPSKEVAFILDFDFVSQFLHYVAVFPHISIKIWLYFLMSVTTSCHSLGLHVFAGCTGWLCQNPVRNCHNSGCSRVGAKQVVLLGECAGEELRWGYYTNFLDLLISLVCLCLFSESSRHRLPIRYYIHIWQVSPQLSCSDTYQIWNWFKILTENSGLYSKNLVVQQATWQLDLFCPPINGIRFSLKFNQKISENSKKSVNFQACTFSKTWMFLMEKQVNRASVTPTFGCCSRVLQCST